MSFTIYGPGVQDPVHLDSLFDKRQVEETTATKRLQPVSEKEHKDGAQKKAKNKTNAKMAQRAYQYIDKIPQDNTPALFANQVMVSPVKSLTDQVVIDAAIKLFQANQFRHAPVLSAEGNVVGMISERDVLHYLGGVTENYEQTATKGNPDKPITQLMHTRVLTASADTDIRYIARLLVERRVGAMPIVTADKMVGIITRSDILRAVMRHFELELWA